MTDILRQPVTDASAWRGEDLERDRSWDVSLETAHVDELKSGLAAVRERGLDISSMQKSDFPVGPALADLAARIVADCRDGRGFVVIRGFPVKGEDTDDVRLMYWGLSQQLGTCVSQDKHAALVADVMDRGQKKTPLTRAYGSKKEAKLHVDLSDVVGLLCVRQAVTSPPSILASSTTVYNDFLANHPEWLERLFEGYCWDRFGEQADWESPITAKIPIFSHADGHLSCRYNRNWITGATVRMNRPLSDDETAMFDYFDQAARANSMSLALHPGDIYFASNYTVLHGKAAHEDEPDIEDVKRLLLRVWINIPGFRHFADEATVRYGLTSHGNIGWTGAELQSGHNLKAGHRRTLCQDEARVAA